MQEVTLVCKTDDPQIKDSEDEQNFTFINGYFQKLPRKPEERDYVLVILDLKKNNVFYVAKVIKVCDSNCYGVSFMRSIETIKCIMALATDMVEVKLADMKMILPPPLINDS